MNKGVHRAGHLEMFGLSGHFVALFVIGPFIDVWGRKPVIMVAIFGDLIRTVLLVVASYYVSDSIMLFLLPAVFIFGATNAFHPAMNAMVADLSKATVEARTSGYSTLKVVSHLAFVIAIGIGFGILNLHLTEYSQVWMIMTAFVAGLLVLAGLVLTETLKKLPPRSGSFKLPEIGGKEVSGSKAAICRRCWKMMKEVTRLVRKDCFLCQLIIVQFFKVAALGIAEATVRPFLISHLGYRQQYASLASLFTAAMLLVGNALSRVWVRRFGPKLVYGGATGVVALGFFIESFAGVVDHTWDDVFFWVGLVIGATGFGVADTAGTVLLSLRVHPEAMGVMFSLEHGLGLVGHLLGVFMATHYLFNAKAQGWHRSSCFAACGAFMGLATLWYFAAYFLLADEDNEEGDSDTSSSCSQTSESESSDSLD